ncbi:WD repeat-containing protein 44 [Tanacetum coccineum]
MYKSQEIQAHNGSIWTIKFSLDGKYLASAGEDCLIHIWQVVSSDRKGDLLFDKQEDGNLNVLLMSNGSPEPTALSTNVESMPERKRRGRLSISRKSISLEPIVVPDTVFALSEKRVCSFIGHLNDVLDLSWSKSQDPEEVMYSFSAENDLITAVDEVFNESFRMSGNSDCLHMVL